MNTRILLSAAAGAAALALTAAAPAQAAGSLLVNFSDDASGFIQANPGDQFFLTGLGGSVTLFDGVAQNVDVMADSQNLTCCYWDNALYTQGINHTLTLNGVGNAFSQTWNVWDFGGPVASITGDGPKVYNVTGGTITVSLNPGSSDLYYSNRYSANLLFQSGGVPEPASWALMLTGFFGAGVVLRANRRTAAATA